MGWVIYKNYYYIFYILEAECLRLGFHALYYLVRAVLGFQAGTLCLCPCDLITP